MLVFVGAAAGMMRSGGRDRERPKEERDVDADLGRDRLLVVAAALMKVLSRWIEEMPMIAVASLTFSTEALTCDSHSGWSGWLSRRMRETKVS